MELSSKIGLGTVQWGMDYGITNQKGRTNIGDVGLILDFAKQNNLNVLDTAYAYGEAEQLLGQLQVEKSGFSVVTKTKPFSGSRVSRDVIADVTSAFLSSTQRLGSDRVHGLLVHHADNLLIDGSDALWAALTELKNEGLIEKLGVSVYSPDQLKGVLERYEIDLVQLPFNIYDQRFKERGLLDVLKKAGVEVHSRSSFLQGLLLMAPEVLPSYFDDIRSVHVRLHQYFKEIDMSPVEACLRFCLEQTGIDKVIVGCESVIQLEEIFRVEREDRVCSLSMSSFALASEKIINPGLWPK